MLFNSLPSPPPRHPHPPLDCSAGRSGAVVPELVLLFGALWFILRGDLVYVLPFAILFLCFSILLALRLPHLGKRALILVLFLRFVLVWICRFPLPLGVWEGLGRAVVCDCGTPWTFLLPFLTTVYGTMQIAWLKCDNFVCFAIPSVLYYNVHCICAHGPI